MRQRIVSRPRSDLVTVDNDWSNGSMRRLSLGWLERLMLRGLRRWPAVPTDGHVR
jgi:hypothetical protein